jgi:endonuclease/exonuclease/phosphatase (EEP) superfamily protein YafD
MVGTLVQKGSAMEIAALVFTSVVVLATVLPLLRTSRWWIRALDFLRLQVAALALITSGIVMFSIDSGSLRLALLLVLGACVTFQGYRLYPYTVFAPRQVLPATQADTKNHLRLLVANIQMDNHQSERFIAALRNAGPDVLCLLETDAWWIHQLRGIAHDYPYIVQQPQDNFYGMAVYSRLPLRNPRVEFVVDEDIPSITAAIELPSGAQIDLYCLHPRPPVPSTDTEERDAELLLVGKRVRQKQRPSIVCGDLNDVAGSTVNRLFQNLSGLLDPRIGRGLYNTHPTYLPIARAPVDHVFHSNELRLVKLERLPDVGSDHFPIFVTLSYEPAQQVLQPEPTPTRQDMAEAHELIAQVQPS